MPTDIPENLFEQIYRRTPNDADRARLLGIKAGLGLSDRDELWPLILTLDHYSATTAAARDRILQMLKAMPDHVSQAVKDVEKHSAAKVENAVAQAVATGADQISRLVVKRSIATADSLTKKQKTFAQIMGGLLAIGFIGIGAVLAWVYIEARVGMCSEPPQVNKDGSLACYVKTVSG